MARIGIGGFQHETNTFSTQPATLDDFLLGGGWPGLLEGNPVVEVTREMNIPIAGIASELLRLGHDVVPLVWTAATPSGRVQTDAFEDIVARFVNAIEDAGRLDGLVLDLHGAMVTEVHDDAEGEFLERLRGAIGEALPIVASLDFHANVSERMFTLTDGLVGFRTYPHVDMRETGERAARYLDQMVRRGFRPTKVWRRVDFLVSLPNQSTLVDPAHGIFEKLEALEAEEGVTSLTWSGGFPLADVPDSGQTVLAYGDDRGATTCAAAQLATALEIAEPEFGTKIWDDHEAVDWALRELPNARGPIVLADTQDNPGGGGSSDTTGLLRCLVKAQAQDAVVGVIHDPEATNAAHRIGVGSPMDLVLGGRALLASGAAGEPFRGLAVVERLGSGKFIGTGPMWGGSPIDLGATALFRIGGVRVIVASRKMQAADQSIFRHVGIEPRDVAILALKSSVHFRADFQSIAHRVLVVASPGMVTARLQDLKYSRIRKCVRIAGAAPTAPQGATSERSGA